MNDEATTHAAAETAVPSVFWEHRYQEAGSVWSGRVNVTTADVARGLLPGRALDLGCGEGGDAVWLAQQGWNVTGIDISPTAITRARASATAAGPMPGTARFDTVDLETWAGDVGHAEDGYDLVAASFFHSPVALTRTRILRNAASRVVAGGHLLIVTHAAAPPWAPPETHNNHTFLTPEEEVAELELDQNPWTVRICQVRSRTTTGPDGEAATLDDGVVLLQRR